MIMKKLYCLVFLIGCSCNPVIEQPPKVKQALVSISETTELVDNEYISLKTGKHLSMACIYDDQADDLPPVVLPVEACNNYICTPLDDYDKLQTYCMDQALRLAICKKFPKKCK